MSNSIADAGLRLAVIGAGTMGQGIAQVAIQGGTEVILFDTAADAAAKAITTIAGRLARLVEKGRIDQAACDTALGLLQPADNLTAIEAADVVIEAVFEELEIKQAVFREIEQRVSSDCILASNTSSIPIDQIAAVCENPHRVAGMHFFNPVPLMKLVEIITATATDSNTVSVLTELGRRMGRTPVVVKDAPGFLVNMGGTAFTTEGLAIAQDGIATAAQIDAVMRDCHDFRMGPFELMDLTGMDVNFPVRQIIHEGYMYDPRLRSVPIHRSMHDAGRYGRKTGHGWYRYEDGRLLGAEAADHQPAKQDYGANAASIALADPGDTRLADIAVRLGLEVVPDNGSLPLLAAPLGTDATDTALGLGIDPKRLVAIDTLGRMESRVTLMQPPGAESACADRIATVLIAAGRKVTLIKDSPGFIGQRMVAMIANLGCYMAETGLASPDDIDLAMQLGLNYPLGPMGLAEAHGTDTLLQVLEETQRITGFDRYRPTPWLRRRARLGLPPRTV